MTDLDWTLLIGAMFALIFAACDVLFRGVMYPREGDIYSRLRAWLRPCPDDAEMQKQMLMRVRQRWFEKRGGNCAVIFGEGVKTQYIWLTNASFETPDEENVFSSDDVWPWRESNSIGGSQ